MDVAHQRIAEQVDAEDADVQATALREAQEEVGLDPRHVQVIGQLPLYITGSAFWVTPVIGLVSPDMALQPNPDEVDDVFEVPLAFLMNPAHHRHHSMMWQGAQRQWFSMPYQESRVAADGEQAFGADPARHAQVERVVRAVAGARHRHGQPDPCRIAAVDADRLSGHARHDTSGHVKLKIDCPTIHLPRRSLM